MPSVDELFAKQMSWPRLILKTAIEGTLCYYFYIHAHAERTSWNCYATGRRQPNGDGRGENVTEAFTNVILAGFLITAIGLFVSVVEMINKKVQNKQLRVLVGLFDTLVGLAGFAWLIWASWVRLNREGKICAGATTNVSEETFPYAYNQGVFL